MSKRIFKENQIERIGTNNGGSIALRFEDVGSRDTVNVRMEVGAAPYFWPNDLRALAKRLLEVADEMEGKTKRSSTPAGLSPQATTILDHLKKVGSISNVEAQALYKCRALPRRIADIKATGVNIQSVYKKDATGQRYARYVLQ